jgi:hypothetical protein
MEGVLHCIISGSFFGDIETILFITMSLKHLKNLWYLLASEDISHELSFTWKCDVEIAKLKKRVTLLVQLKDSAIFWDASGEV